MIRSQNQKAKRLQKILDRMGQGGKPGAEFNSPDTPEEPLHGELKAAAWLVEHRSLANPSMEFVEDSRSRVLARVKTLQKPRPTRWLGGFESLLRTRTAVTIALIVVAAFVFVNGSVAVRASTVSIPGDLVYPVKLAVESFQLLTTFSASGDADLHLLFANNRLRELQYLALEGRYEYIPDTSTNFRQHVNSSIVLLDRVHGSDPAQADVLRITMHQLLTDASEALVLMSGLVPSDSSRELASAVLVSANSTHIADAINGK